MNGSDEMLLYSANIQFDEMIEYSRNKIGEWLYAINEEMDSVCKSRDFLLRAVDVKKNKLSLVVLVKNYLITELELTSEIVKIVTYGLRGKAIQKLDVREITSTNFASLLNKYANRHFKKDKVTAKIQEVLPENMMFPFRHGVEFWEEMIKVPKKTNFRAKAQRIKANEILVEEMERIYSENHPKQYRGIPAHYKISATSEKIAKEIVYVLLQSLYTNKRILSKRMTYIKFKSSNEYMESTVDKIFNLGAGGCVVIDMFEEPISNNNGWWENNNDDWSFFDSDENNEESEWGTEWWRPNSGEATKSFASKIEKKSNETLFIFIENAKCPSDSERLYKILKEKINLIEIKEGLNGRLAQQLYKDMVDKAELSEYYESDKLFKESQYYSKEDVESKFRDFSQKCMTDKIYTEYGKEKLKDDNTNKESVPSHVELQRLTGLTNVKQVVNDIISVHKVNKMRSTYGENNETASLSKHMLFSGNPGTAKTTVARLMAKIMKEEGLLKTGKFIECGRSELVGQFVGWTAVQVKDMFRKAKGGVLFIDEAYSLVDDGNNFGDEAINTIVAEMENMRDEVIVIFAGYPDKMKTFLDKNEGLKSRISYHIHFPDYTPEELLEILEKLATDRSFVLSNKAKEKTIKIFQEVSCASDFGNGRFARNLLEQAIFKQASRITAMPKEEITKDCLFELTEEDITYKSLDLGENRHNKIGFII